MKKKVLIVGPGMEIGGVERSLMGLLNSIDYSKYDVDLYLFAHTGEFMPYINKNVNLIKENSMFFLATWPIGRLIKQGHFLVASIRIIAKLIGDIRAKILHTSSINISLCKKMISCIVPNLKGEYDIALGFFGPHFFIDKRVTAKKKIGWVHTDYSNSEELPDIKFSLPMWSKLDEIACVSNEVKNSFDSVFPSLKEKTIVVENILSSEFVKEQADAFNVEDEMPKDGYFNILSVGRFCTAKGFDDAVIACSKLVEKGYNIKWYFIGYGPDEKLILDTISKYKIKNNAIVLGKKSNPYPYMKACDLYAQPSRYEGKAVTVREAQMLNKPVMITRFETSAGQLEEGFDGYICETGIYGIVAGIEHLVNHPDIRANLVSGTKSKNYDNSQEIYKVI